MHYGPYGACVARDQFTGNWTETTLLRRRQPMGVTERWSLAKAFLFSPVPAALVQREDMFSGLGFDALVGQASGKTW